MKFVKLTCRDSGKDVYVNVEKIRNIRTGTDTRHKNCGYIRYSEEVGDYTCVQETADEIIKKIEVDGEAGE